MTSLANLVTSPSEVNQTAMQWLELTVEGHTQVYKYSTLLPAHGDCISDRSRCEAQHVKVLVNLLDWGTQRRPWHETLPLTEGTFKALSKLQLCRQRTGHKDICIHIHT